MGLRGGEVEAEVLDRAPPVPGTALPEGLAGCGASTTRSHFATHIGPICRVEMKPVSLAAPDAPVASQPFAILSKTRGQKNFQLFSQTVEIPGGHLHFLPRLLGVPALREGPRVHASRVGARTRSPFLCSLSSSPFLPIGSEGGISFFSASSFAVVRPVQPAWGAGRAGDSSQLYALLFYAARCKHSALRAPCSQRFTPESVSNRPTVMHEASELSAASGRLAADIGRLSGNKIHSRFARRSSDSFT